MNKPATSPVQATASEKPAAPAAGTLAELTAMLTARQAVTDQDAQRRAAYPELPELAWFRDTWSRLNARRQLQKALDKVPENAGPLNSSNLVHRALLLMREASPGYLEHHLAYLDALAWMEQLSAALEPAREPARAGNTRKTTRPRQP